MISSKDPVRYWPGFSAPGLALYGASRRQKRGGGGGGLRRSMEREREGRVRTGMKYRRGRREARNNSLIFSSAVNRWSHAKNRSMARPNLAHDINSPETNRFPEMIPLGLSRSMLLLNDANCTEAYIFHVMTLLIFEIIKARIRNKWVSVITEGFV